MHLDVLFSCPVEELDQSEHTDADAIGLLNSQTEWLGYNITLTVAPIAFAVMFLLNFTLRAPLFPCDPITFPHETRKRVLFTLFFTL